MAVVMARGAMLGSGIVGTAQAAVVAMLALAVVGAIVGAIAAATIDQSVQQQLQAQLDTLGEEADRT